MGPNKMAIVHFSNKRNRMQHNYSILSTESYRYLGKQIQLRANQTVHLNAWKTAQVKLRLSKFSNSLNMVSKATFICRHSFAQFRTALIAIASGNMYGLADHTTPIYEVYARGALKEWKVKMRKTIKIKKHIKITENPPKKHQHEEQCQTIKMGETKIT